MAAQQKDLQSSTAGDPSLNLFCYHNAIRQVTVVCACDELIPKPSVFVVLVCDHARAMSSTNGTLIIVGVESGTQLERRQLDCIAHHLSGASVLWVKDNERESPKERAEKRKRQFTVYHIPCCWTLDSTAQSSL